MSEVKFVEENENLSEEFQVVENNSKLKELIIQYVGEKLNPKNDEVTVEMVFDVFRDEFPEFVLILAEENYLRGFQDGLSFDDTLEIEEEVKNDEKKSD